MTLLRKLWNRRPWRTTHKLGDIEFWIPPDAGLDWKEITLAPLIEQAREVRPLTRTMGQLATKAFEDDNRSS